MHYYPHNMKSFDTATRHLTRLERGLYRDLIELYYRTELHLPKDFAEICRKALAHTQEEQCAVAQLLKEFFREREDGWWHEHCEEVLKKYRTKKKANRLNGKKGGRPRSINDLEDEENNPEETQEKPNGLSEITQQEPKHNLNQEPITKNQEPIKDRARRFTPPSLDEVRAYCNDRRNGIDPQAFIDHYEVNDWIRGKTKMKNWQAAVRTWERNQTPTQKTAEDLYQ